MVVLPSTFMMPVAVLRIIRDVPPMVAVPAAAVLAVSVRFIVHSVDPLTTSWAPLPPRLIGSSMSPSESNVGELIVKMTPSLIVCVVPEPRPSQSNVATLTVVFGRDRRCPFHPQRAGAG